VYSHEERPQRLYLALGAILVVVLLWFAWQSTTGAAAQAASKAAIETAEQVLKYNRQGERTLLTVTTIFGVSIVLAAIVIPYVALVSSAPQLPTNLRNSGISSHRVNGNPETQQRVDPENGSLPAHSKTRYPS